MEDEHRRHGVGPPISPCRDAPGARAQDSGAGALSVKKRAFSDVFHRLHAERTEKRQVFGLGTPADGENPEKFSPSGRWCRSLRSLARQAEAPDLDCQGRQRWSASLQAVAQAIRPARAHFPTLVDSGHLARWGGCHRVGVSGAECHGWLQAGPVLEGERQSHRSLPQR